MSTAVFETPLRTEYLREGHGGVPLYRLTDDLILRMPTGRYIVPRGFETDLASVPRILWWFISPWGDHAAAAVVHDFLYRVRCHTVSRFFADAIFRWAMAECGVSLPRRWIMWAAVRLFGGRSFGPQRRKWGLK